MKNVKTYREMVVILLYLLTLSSVSGEFFPFGNEEGDYRHLYPKVVIAFFARNKAHTLPYFLGQVEELEYPKDRIILFIRTDHNVDGTKDVLDQWVASVKSLYR